MPKIICYIVVLKVLKQVFIRLILRSYEIIQNLTARVKIQSYAKLNIQKICLSVTITRFLITEVNELVIQEVSWMSMSTRSLVILLVSILRVDADLNHLTTSQTMNDHTTLDSNIGWQDPSNIHRMEVTNCSYVVVNGFLKERCSIDNFWFYKCPNSYRFYKINHRKCHETIFSRVCPNDKTSYQACGHNRNIDICGSVVTKKAAMHDSVFGPDVAACGEIICQLVHDPQPKQGNPFVHQQLQDGLSRRIGIIRSRSMFACDDSAPLCSNTVDGIPVNEYGCKEQPMFRCML
jgi:hypothetical protein